MPFLQNFDSAGICVSNSPEEFSELKENIPDGSYVATRDAADTIDSLVMER
jgi:hypothetical protein